MANIENVVKSKVLEATKMVEEQLDSELEKLDKLELSDIQKYREQRLNELKKQQQQKQEWLAKGHGTYTEIDEKEFFDLTKKCNQLICHFYKSNTMRCKIVDHHLNLLATRHIEAKFCKLNAEKAPFLTDRLQIKIIPTLLLIKDSITVDRIVGFSELGNRDDFRTEMMEWRIAKGGLLDYSGDLSTPPEHKNPNNWRSVFLERKKTIRNSNLFDSSDDELY